MNIAHEIIGWAGVGVLSLALILIFVYLFAALASSSRREDAASFPEPINTWFDDFTDWKLGRCTLDEFLDRRARIREMR